MNLSMTTKEVAFYSVPAIFGSIFTYAFGAYNGLLEIFFIAILLDWVTGVSASVIEGRGISSKQGYKGILKKSVMVLVVFFAHRVDIALDLNWVMIGSIYFWLANELTSVVENLTRMGIPCPPVIRKVLTILKEKDENTEQK